MRPSVRAAFYDFNAPLEGEIPYFYQDVKGLVSIGVGILCDPVELAFSLPLVKADGSPASRNDISAEFWRIKGLPPNAQGLTAARGGHLFAKPHTTLHLTKDGLRLVLERKLDQMERYLVSRFSEFDDWPADAQLGTLSLSWACGPAFRFPKLEAALKARDFAVAAVECFMPEERTISGLRPRNKANRILFKNAAVAAAQMDPEVLFWPRDLSTIGIDPESSEGECESCGGSLKRFDAAEHGMSEDQFGCDDCGAMFTAAGKELAISPSNFDIVHPKVPLGDDE